MATTSRVLCFRCGLVSGVFKKHVAPGFWRGVKIEGGSAAAWGLRSKVLGFGQSEELRRFRGCCLAGCFSSSSIKGGGIKAQGVEKGVVSKR